MKLIFLFYLTALFVLAACQTSNKDRLNNNHLILNEVIKQCPSHYFDGCNVCKNGFCTEIACEKSIEKPKCL